MMNKYFKINKCMDKIYCLSGLGTDEKVFANLNIEGYTLEYIPW